MKNTNKLLLLLVLFLFPVIVFATSGKQLYPVKAAAQSSSQEAITPTLYCLGACPTLPVEDTPGVPTTTHAITPAASTSPISSSSPSPTPSVDLCAEESKSSTNTFKNKHKHKHKHKDGSKGGFFEAFFRLLFLLFQYLLGGGTVPPINPPITPTPSDMPGPTITPDPCITPTVSIAPVSIVPTSIPSITVSPSLPVQPTITSGTQAPIDLSNWKLQLPIGEAESPTEITSPDLASYTNDPWYMKTQEGIRFRAAVNGVTTSGSDYPRSELREMSDNGSSQASWDPATGTHTMTIEEAITAVPATKKHVVAGQIHDGSDDIVVIRLEMPKLFVDIGGTAGPTLDENYTLGKRFSVRFEVTGGKTNIYYNGGETPMHTMNSDYSSAYFKAGAYTQSNCTKEASSACNENNFGEVMIYQLNVTHQ